MEATMATTIAPGAPGQTSRSAGATGQGKNAGNKKRIALFVGIGVAAVGIGGYLLWPVIKRKFFSGNANSGSSNPTPAASIPTASDFTTAVRPSTSSSSSSSATKPKDAFPLKKGSKGPNVKALQDALIAKYGSTILPKYGADSDFGSEVEAALKSKGLPTVVDETTYNKLVQATASAAQFAAEKLNKDIMTATREANFSKVLTLLTQIKTPQQYSAVSNLFKEEKIFFYLPTYTLVTGMFRTFTTSEQTKQLRDAFTNMGLKWNQEKDTWSLSGLGGFNVITVRPTLVWKDPQTAIKVPASLVLGQEVEKRNNYIAFESNGRKFLVPAQDVRYV